MTVAVDDDASDFFTVIEIGAPDRIGLLYDITRTLSDLRSTCTSRRWPRTRIG